MNYKDRNFLNLVGSLTPSFGSEGWADGYADLPDDSRFYFVHSYYVKAEEEDIITSSAEYGVHIHASVERGNVFATQFHPEKSSSVGLKILKNFIDYKG